MECIAKDIFKRFKPRCVAIPQREVAGPSCLNWHGAIYNGVKLYKSKNYKITHVIDKIGTGDAFGAGIIYGLNSGYDLQKTLEFATASSCLKNTVGGDFNHISFSEAEDLLCTKDYIS
jgi:2-dehydro-3-deoxygluconokinase